MLPEMLEDLASGTSASVTPVADTPRTSVRAGRTFVASASGRAGVQAVSALEEPDVEPDVGVFSATFNVDEIIESLFMVCSGRGRDSVDSSTDAQADEVPAKATPAFAPVA